MKNLIKIKTLAIIFAVVAIGTTGTILLVKNFESKEYTIAFDSNGGSSVDSLTIKEDETINEPSMPTKEGYIFEGWYYNGEKFDFSTKVTKDMTLEARWQIENNGDLIVDAKELNLTVGASKQVKTTLTGNLKDTKLIWKSSDEKIATVDKNGNVKGLKSGKANITVTTEDGSKTESITINVTEPVKDEPTIKPDDTSKNDSTDKTVTVSSVSITNLTGENQVYAGETVDLKAVINPSDAVNKDVTWTVDKEDLGKVATDGLNATLITKVKGVVKVTVTTADGGKTATIEIEII